MRQLSSEDNNRKLTKKNPKPAAQKSESHLCQANEIALSNSQFKTHLLFDKPLFDTPFWKKHG